MQLVKSSLEATKCNKTQWYYVNLAFCKLHHRIKIQLRCHNIINFNPQANLINFVAFF